MWEFVFNRIMICQIIFVFFTGCVFIVKRGAAPLAQRTMHCINVLAAAA